MPDFMEPMVALMAANMAGVYLCLFIAPFVQEDAAVIGAASLSLNGMGEHALIFAAIAAGLCASDLWKYAIGRAARSRDWARRFAARPRVQRAEKVVSQRLGAAIATARFLPGARIALYIAAGYFAAPFARFAFWIVVTALGYIGAIFALFHLIGMAAGEAAKVWAPVGALGLVGLVLALQFARNRTGQAPAA
ncbi:MAG: VTT domain-containing protein [Pseudomonadota bacterium]